MATGGTDSNVRLFVRPPGGDFQLACQLKGHENWVKDLAFARVLEPRKEGGMVESLLLASASQDRWVRGIG
jgi:hypothetical protein